MSQHIGRLAVVIGAGVGGLTAARVLRDHFERVIVLEGDPAPRTAAPRPGTPQSRHLHALLAGGLNALNTLFPGFDQDLVTAGAVPAGMTQDLQLYRPGHHPFAQRDLGMTVYSVSRPLIEWLIRRRTESYETIDFRHECKAVEFAMRPGAQRIHSVRYQRESGAVEEIPSDFVVDASGHGLLTLQLLASAGRPKPEETTVNVDIGYATTTFEIPADAPSDWKALVVHPHPPENRRGAFLFPIEGKRWMVVLCGRYEEKPSDDDQEFFAHVQRLPTSTLHDALRPARRCGGIARFAFKASRWRRFDKNFALPENLVPFGDSICRFNPVYGQGMSVAAQQACALESVLSAAASEGAHEEVSRQFVTAAQDTIETPWATAVVPDFLDERTEGERPAELEKALKFSAGLFRKASEDAAVHKLMLEVQHLLKPRSALRAVDVSL